MKLINIIISSIIILCLDFLYLTPQNKYFHKLFLNLQGEKMKIRIVGVILCYIALILALNYFIFDKKGSYLDAFLLGFFIYVVYETTNYATFSNWPIRMLIVDSLWGGILFVLTFYLTKFIKKYFKIV